MISSGTAAVELQLKGPIATLTINQQARHNALKQSMWQSLADHIDSLSQNAEVRCVIVRGAGDKAFSAGADISEFSELARDMSRLKANNHIVQAAQAKLEELNRPTIAMIRGICFGGGCGIALACDFRVCNPAARFAITPSKLGLIYSARDTRRLLDIAGPSFTKEMLYTGKSINADEALRRGIVSHIANDAELEDYCFRFAQQLAEGAQYSIRGIKEVIAMLEGYGSKTAEDIEAMYDAAFNLPDCEEGVAAFMAKREPKFTWG